MNASILIDRLPVPVEHLKSLEPERYSAIGEAVNDSGLLQALLSHGSFDHYYYVDRPETPRDIAGHYRDSARLQAITLNSLAALDECGPLLLFTSSILFQQYASFRLARKHPEWPICGVTHTLSTIYPRVSFGSPKLFSYDAVICTTPGARRTLQRLMEEHARSEAVVQPRPALPAIRYPVIPLGVDPASAGDPARKRISREELDIAQDAFVLLFFGRLSAINKADFHPLIRTFFEAPDLPDDSYLMIAGDDTRHHLAEPLRAFAAQFESPRTVSILPDITREKKQALLSAADVFLAISDTVEETFGLTVVEAMMSGLAVIASDWDGYRHLIRSGEDGLLAPTYMFGDGMELSALGALFPCAYHFPQRVCLDLDSLAEMLRTLAHDPDLRGRLGAAARKRALEEFAWPTLVGRYEALWREQLAEGAASRHAAEEFRYPAVYDYGAVFDHYFTRPIGLADRVSIREGSARALQLLSEDRLFLKPDPAFQRTVDEEILALCRNSGEVSIGDILRRLERPEAPAVVLISQICRLIKYGLLRLHFK
jgi:glycosyltransferase involved in cell wall biosynthesis